MVFKFSVRCGHWWHITEVVFGFLKGVFICVLLAEWSLNPERVVYSTLLGLVCVVPLAVVIGLPLGVVIGFLPEVAIRIPFGIVFRFLLGIILVSHFKASISGNIHHLSFYLY